ncbi:MAG TPA: 2-oxo-4-hydroxy-4-carboxy-5-ureidoimidazoline decarboxylase [Pyrinomonadaceae bacterium]
MSAALQRLNSLSAEDAAAELLKCCGSTRWAEEMTGARPFRNLGELEEKADSVWRSLDEEDWLEAFSRHPKIGESKAAREIPSGAEKWSEQEQSGARAASGETLSELARLNRAYEERFGHIYIVCATGKSSEEMLAILKERLANDPRTELRAAAEEQRKITRLRLRKLLEAV